ncbi:hypothetical protein [Donghicola tyrosinivorans]|uniref:Abortive infection Abi-like protein n=1 Tax=Donghicola tyrosinivorans TaxID=1652492 RepID=A0A2T0WYI9_9RHOB|nr:hypothetical protein [Donghicola tyrosinivorans]PRY91715.1 hypothetical protein CLV74_103304 [Donghicola tyrosinivorans]
MKKEKTGERFSILYLQPAELQMDSDRARFRIAKQIEKFFADDSRPSGSSLSMAARDAVESLIGIPFKTPHTSVHTWEKFVGRIEFADVLDVITVLTGVLRNIWGNNSRSVFFILAVRRIFSETNLAYEIDDLGGVHPLIDAAFSKGVASAIRSLDEPRYAATARLVKRIDSCLLDESLDYVGGVRAIFGACENLFKLMFDVPRLDAKSVCQKLQPSVQSLYATRKAELGPNMKMLNSFQQWIDSAHFFRHEPGHETVETTSAELGQLLISQGLGYVRWLAQIDKATQ